MGRSPSLERARRPLPANLSLDQRRALEQFLDGQISAGAMSSKLEEAEPGGAPADPAWEPTTRHKPARQMVAPTRRRRVAFPATLMATLLLAMVGTYVVSSASTSSEGSRRASAAKPQVKTSRTRHHRGAAGTDSGTLITSAGSANAGASTTASSSTAGRPAPKRGQHATPGKAHGRGLKGNGGPAGKPGAKPKAAGHPAGPTPKPGTQTTAANGGGTGPSSGGSGPSGGASSGQGTTTSPGTTTNPAPSGTGNTSSLS